MGTNKEYTIVTNDFPEDYHATMSNDINTLQ